MRAPFHAAGEHIGCDLPAGRVLFTTRRGGVSRAPFDTLNLGRWTDDDPEAVDANRERLARDDLDESSAFLVAHLVPGCEAYRRRSTPTVAEAIETIHGAGGVAVWAHPFWDLASPGDVMAALERFTAAGLDGVEAFYATHDREQTRLLARAAAERGLLSTGSADFHGPAHRLFSRFRAFELHGCEANLGPIGA